MPNDPVVSGIADETVDEWMGELSEILQTVWKVAKETEDKQKTLTRRLKDREGKRDGLEDRTGSVFEE